MKKLSRGTKRESDQTEKNYRETCKIKCQGLLLKRKLLTKSTSRSVKLSRIWRVASTNRHPKWKERRL